MSDVARLAMNTFVELCSCFLLTITQRTRALPIAVARAMMTSMAKLLMAKGSIMLLSPAKRLTLTVI